MVKKIISFVLVLTCLAGLFAGCETVSEIADNVLEAAKQELANQIKATLEENKVEVVEVKPLVGTLNDEGGKYQFFCAVLVKTNSEDNAAGCADTLGKVFGQADYAAQTSQKLENEHLVHKSVAFSTEDYSEGNYYTVWVYTADLTKIVDLDAIKQSLTKSE